MPATHCTLGREGRLSKSVCVCGGGGSHVYVCVCAMSTAMHKNRDQQLERVPSATGAK